MKYPTAMEIKDIKLVIPVFLVRTMAVAKSICTIICGIPEYSAPHNIVDSGDLCYNI